MQFRILGPIQALVDDHPAALGAPKQRGLLALLLVNRRRVVTAEQLIDGLWGESPPASALRSLQVYAHGLRRALGSERIETAGRGYRVVVGEDELDLDRFERMLDRGRAALEAGRADDAADDLREAIAVWRGPALADLPEETRRAAEAERPEELRLTALELRHDAELACGRHDAVVAELEALTAEHPYRERFLEQRLLALYRCGRQAEALEVYRNARERLAAELGLDPSPALQELERAILRQEPSLAAPEAPARSTRPLPVPPRRSSAAGSSSRRSARCSETKARGSSRSPAPAERARPAWGSPSRRSSSPSSATAPCSSASRPSPARSCSWPRSPRRSACARASACSPRA